MFLRFILPFLVFFSVNSDDLDDAKAKRNMITNPVGRERPSDVTDETIHYCNGGDSKDLFPNYSCCYESYRMLSTMTYACKLVDISSEDKFNEEKDLLKDYNAKNITIKCNGTFTHISMVLVIMMFLFMI